MARLYWRGLSEKRDGRRRILHVEFREEGTGQVHWWRPRWDDMIDSIDRACEVEVTNQAGSPYESRLDAARRQLVDMVSDTANMEGPVTDPVVWVWCPDCDWHASSGCACPLCLGLDLHD